MRKEEAPYLVQLLLEGNVVAFNEFRRKRPDTDTELGGIILSDLNLSGVNFSGANLTEAVLRKIDFSGADFEGANLRGSIIAFCNLSGANLCRIHGSILFLAVEIDTHTRTDHPEIHDLVVPSTKQGRTPPPNHKGSSSVH